MIDTAAVARPRTRVDRGRIEPLYYQLVDILVHNIQTIWQQGDRLPSESELCRNYSVSRTVVRQALDGLEGQGLIHKVKGKGSFVAQRKLDATFVQRAAGFYESMTRQGHEVQSRVLKQGLAPAGVRVAQMLRMDVNEPVLQLDRVRSVDGVPIQVVRSCLPHRLCPGLEDVDLEDVSLYAVLRERFGLQPAAGRRTIEAVAISREDAKHLGVKSGSPGLQVESVTETMDGEPFEYFMAIYRGDRSKVDIQLIPET